MSWQWKFLADLRGTPGDVSLYGPAWAPTRNVPANADLNTFRTPGIHRISTPDTATILNLPPGTRTASLVENITPGTGTDALFTQRVTELGDSARKLWRSAFTSGGALTPWALDGVSGAPVTEWHVFLAVGQSNMSGRGIVSAANGGKYMQSRVAQFGFNHRVLETATVPLDMHDPALGLSPASVFANNYLRTQPDNVGVVLVAAAHGGTGFTTSTAGNTWSPNVATNPIYDLPKIAVDQTKDAIAAAKVGGAAVTLKGILWHQGENNTSMSQATYATNLDTLIAYFRAQLGDSKLPFIVGQMVPEGIEANAGRPNIDAAHQDTPNRVPYTGFAPARRSSYNFEDATPVHFNRDGVDFLGRTYLEAFEQVKASGLALGTIPALAVAAVPAAVASYIANDSTVIQAAADMAANNSNLLAKWKPNTAYALGQQVVSPDGDVVTRAVAGTSGATFTMTNWTPSPGASGLAGKLDASQKGAASGVATLDSTSKVPVTQIPDLSATYAAKAVEASKVDVSSKGIANGVATLDSGAQVPVAQIPNLSATYAAKSTETSKLNASEKGAASGVAPLGSDLKVPDANLPQRLQDADLSTKIDGRVPAAVNTAVPPAVAAYIASDPSVVNAAATMAASNAGLIPRWKPSTAYTLGQQIIAPDGDVVTAASAFTSGPVYISANWVPSSTAARSNDQDTRTPKVFDGEDAWRVRDRGGQSALAVTKAGGTKMGAVEYRQLPATSPYTFVIRDRAGQVALSVNATGNGGNSVITELHAFIIGGQSNMSGRGTPYGAEFDPVDSRILQYGSKNNTAGKITTSTVPLDMHDAAGGLSPATVFAREYLKTQPGNVGVLLIPAAHGGTGFYTSSETPLPAGYVTPNAGGGTWQYNRSEPVNLYLLMVAQTTAALAAATSQLGLTASVKAFLWHQGEGDTTQTDQAGYSGHFDALVTDLRTRFGSTLPVVLGGMSPDWIGTTANRLAIRAAHVDTPRRITRSAFAKAAPDTGKYQDEIHFGRAGVEILGAGYVEAYKRALGNVTTSSPMAPRNTRATFIGGTLTVEWDYPMSRVTSFVVEYSIDGGAWTTITRALPMDYREVKTGLSGSVAQVRISTVNEVGTSAPSTPTTALGA